MATIVNTPAHEHVAAEDRSSSALNTIIAILAVAVLVFLLFYFGLPLMRGGGQAPQQINNNVPPQAPQGQSGAAPQINVPDKINVDVNNPQGQ